MSPHLDTPNHRTVRFTGYPLELLIELATLVGLYLVSFRNFLLFHTLVELFTIAIGLTLFIIAWNVRRTATDHYILFLGIACLSIAVLDLFHALTYRGMGILAVSGANTATQMWIAARFVQALALLVAPYFLTHRLRSGATLFLFALVTGLLLASILGWDIFPVCYIEGVGLTPFKVVSEYLIALILLTALIVLYRVRPILDRTVLLWIAASIVATIASEMAFTFYMGVYDLANIVGHYLRIIAFYLLYKAVVETGLVKPYALLFRNLVGQREALREEKQRAQSYLDVAGIIVVLNPDGTIALINQAGCDLLGCDEQEVVGKNWFSTFIPETFRDEAQVTFARLLISNPGEKDFFESPVMTREGMERTIRWHPNLLKDEGGRVTGILSAGEDITEWIKAEAEKTNLASFPRLNPHPVVEVELDGKVHFLNPTAERLFPDLDRLGPEHPWLKDWDAWIGQFFADQSQEGQREIEAGGKWYHQLMYFVSENRKIRIYGLDITQRRQAEERLKKIHGELEERVRERTSQLDLANRLLTSEIEQRERAQKDLEKQSHLLEAFFNHSVSPIVFLDRDFNFIRVNEAYATACRRDATEFIGHNHFEFYPSEAEALFRQVVETKRGCRAYAMPFVFPDHLEWGTTYWDWTLVPILDEAGEVDFLVFSLNDITERKLVEEEGQKNARLLDLANDTIIVCNIEGDITYWNRGAEKLYGWTRGEVIGRNLGDLLQAEFVMPPEAVQEILFREDYWEGEIVHTRKDGGKVTVLSRWTLQRDHRDIPISYSEINRDITELKRKERELRESSLYTRNLIEASLDPLVTINAEGKIMDVSRATELMTGVDRERLVGSDFSDYFTDPQKAREVYRTVFSQGYIRDYPLAIRHVSGRTTEVLYNATVYRDEGGRVQGVFAAARDVTELRTAQRALQQSHDELELRVEERTAELEAANRELESFSYSVSHDLQTPLRAIDGYSRMILRDSVNRFDDETRQRFGTIRQSAQMMGQLINDLLAFSRLGRKEITPSRLDMEGLLDDVWQELQVIHPERKMTLEIGPMPPAFGDRMLIKQVLLNLLSNAIKFTRPRECARIQVRGTEDGDRLVYDVIDNGVGFDMAYHDKMFGVFQRLHNSDEFEGTGVGLAIVQRIIHRHGGKVWAEGKPDEGASFHFSLKKERGNAL